MSSRFELDPDFERKLKKLSEPEDVPLAELCPPAFMQANTSFSTMQEMLDRSPAASTPQEEIAAVFDTQEWDGFVREHSRFESWKAMLKAAGAAHVKRRWNSG